LKLQILLSVTMLLSACRATVRTGEENGDLKGLASNNSSKNIALMMTGLNKDKDDRIASIAQTNRLRKFLNLTSKSPPFEIREFQEATKDELLAHTTQAAKDVGKSGTLIWYVATHGWTDGFEMKSGRVVAAEITQALKARVGRGSFSRLIMIFDYCGAGGTVGEMKLDDTLDGSIQKGQSDADAFDLANGALSLRTQLMKNSLFRPESFINALSQLADGLSNNLSSLTATNDTKSDTRIYDNAIFMSPTSPTQETIGGTMTMALFSVAREAKTNRPKITIGQFLKETAKSIGKQKTEDFFGSGENDFVLKKQTMVFRTLPDSTILNDLLFTQ
jgi:hypothetical protein